MKDVEENGEENCIENWARWSKERKRLISPKKDPTI